MSFIKITIKSPVKRSHIKKIPISKTAQIKTSVHITRKETIENNFGGT